MFLYELFNRSAGWTECRVTGALPAGFLNRCAQAGVAVLSAVAEGDFSLRVRLRTRDLPRARRLAQRAQCSLDPCVSGGAARTAKRLRRRIPLAAALLAAVVLLAWSKFYIWEIDVTGNETVPTGRILDALRECGVAPGAYWPALTADQVRARLLTELPELGWATVNIYGSRAEAVVRERVKKPELFDPNAPVDVTAKRVGFVTRVQALNGTALVRPGSAVLPGETLISAQMDSAWSGPRLVHALGSVRAETYYELTASAPLTKSVREPTGESRSRWAVVLGKNRWNFFGNSSISRGDCVKITTVWDFSRAGLFSLPLRIVRETEQDFAPTERDRDFNALRRAMEESLRARLLSELGPEGEAESVSFSASASESRVTVTLRARCSEEIGVETPRVSMN